MSQPNGVSAEAPRRKNRSITIAAAQLGPVHPSTPYDEISSRLLSLLSAAASEQAQLVVFPELALTTFFPRYTHLIHSPAELEGYFEHSADGTDSGFAAEGNERMGPLFARARDLGMDVSIGFAECESPLAAAPPTDETGHKHWNSCLYYSAREDRVLSKYRKVHLPGTKEPFKDPKATNQLEKRYFGPGNLGFEAFRAPGLIEGAEKRGGGAGAPTDGQGDPIFGMMICNDRRWPEAWRCLGLQGVEVMLCGFNTVAWATDMVGVPAHNDTDKQSAREASKAEAIRHHYLTVQHGSYTNACWSVNVAKCGVEDPDTKLPGQEGGFELIPGTCIVDPNGAIAAQAKTEGDEVVVWKCDLGMCRRGKEKVFAFERHRRVEAYGRLVEQIGVEEPELLSA